MATMETPRVSCSYLNSYVNRNVLVVGKVVQLRGESAIVDADGHITVNLNRVGSFLTSQPRSRL
jgi:replication factor A3